MNKQDVVTRLISVGYDAYLENGVVMVQMPITTSRIRRMENLLRSIGYRASWGAVNVEGKDGKKDTEPG